MANTITALKPDYSRRRKTARFSVALSGNYTPLANGGEVLDFTNVLNPSFQNRPGLSGTVPPYTDFKVVRMPAGYNAVVSPTGVANPTLANAFALRIYSSPETEAGNVAYSANMKAEAVVVEANVEGWAN